MHRAVRKKKDFKIPYTKRTISEDKPSNVLKTKY